MKVMHLAVFLATCLAAPAFAQGSPGEVTKAQVAAYRFGMDAGCRNTGRQKGDPQAKIEFICSCMTGTLDRHLSFGDWQQAAFLSMKKGEQEAMQFLQPQLAKMRECKP